MLYLEDYLEMIEHLPSELRDRFTEMRELDLTVQNNIDSLDKKVRTFFLQCKRGEIQEEAIDTESQKLRQEYYKVLEDADEKVVIATQIHELVERYLRRLDSELFKFKCELEADNNGITEILEKRSLENEGGSTAATSLLNVINMNNQKENHYYGSVGALAGSNSHGMLGVSGGYAGVTVPHMASVTPKDNRYRASRPEKRRNSATPLSNMTEKRPNLGNNLTPSTPTLNVMRPVTPGLGTHGLSNPTAATVATPGTPTTVPYNLQQLGGSASNAIAVAASQAIVATQQMQQGRRTASLKASYEAIHGAGGGPTEFWISRDIANAATAAAQNSLQSVNVEKKKKKLNSSLPITGNTGSITTPSSAISLASSSSSVSVDSMDMLPSSSSVSGIGGVSSLNLAAVSGGIPTAAASRGGSASSSSTSSMPLASSSGVPLTDNGLVVEQTADGEWSYDPNEPRYCTCNQVSYGDMVACDNDACPYEWFHYPCVGITQPPKGKWYCPKCTASMRRRGNRKNQ